jgi:uncharacterized membrane protein AbrB (regulator of aidB expression)
MKAGYAFAEDLRRVGVAAIVAGVIGGFLQDQVPIPASWLATVLGVTACFVGYWLHDLEEHS